VTFGVIPLRCFLSVLLDSRPGAFAVPLLFALTMFVSATLLFLVQPMIGKMVLPLLGGTPAVWNTCMVFYQALLLFGYFYAHKSTAYMPTKRQTTVHAAILLLGLGALALSAILTANHSPMAIAKSLSPQGDDYPFFGIIVVLAVAIGLPFFVVSTSAPLLQKWFADTGHRSSRDPYFLYAASNFGSLLALVAYPAFVEPNLRLVEQAWVWAIGYAVLTALVIACARVVNRSRPADKTELPKGNHAPVAVNDPEPTLLRKLRWVALAFVPSSLMLGITTFITTDMLSIPLLWIVPLTLYLITFIIVFSKVPSWVHLSMTLLMPVAVLLVAFVMTSHVTIKSVEIMGLRIPKLGIVVGLHMLTFFIVAMVCHGELANDRPSPKHLTNFYLLMSIGGMLGGLFNAFFAPIVFTFTSEYPITLVIACFLLPSLFQEKHRKLGSWTHILDFLVPCGVFFFCRLMQQNNGELSRYVYENGTLIIASIILFSVPAIASVVFLENGVSSRVALGIFLGASLLLYATVGPLSDYLFLENSPREWMKLGFGNLRTSTILRWLAVALSVAAYAGWARYDDRSKLKTRLLTGMGALAACFSIMLAGAYVFASGDESFWVREFKKHITPLTLHQILIFGVPAMICYFFVERPVRFGGAVAALWLATYYTEIRASSNEVVRVRSFFGRVKIETDTQWKLLPAELFPKNIEDDKEHYDIDRLKDEDDEIVVLTPKSRDESVYQIRIEKKGGKEVKTYFIRRDHTTLVHGTTTHGLQEKNRLRTDILRALWPVAAPNVQGVMLDLYAGSGEAMLFPGRDPTTYYHRTGPVGSMFQAWTGRNLDKNKPNTDVACIGLGTGSLSAYGLPGQRMTFFEIDTRVRRLVEPPTHFTYIDNAKKQGVNVDFVMGDARISLERMKRKFGCMLVDAFSSDAIPAHLLTLQAFKLYFDHLEEDGLLVVHISNRYLDLEPVVERICRELNLHARIMHSSGDRVDNRDDGNHAIDSLPRWYSSFKNASSWIVIAKSKEALGAIENDYEQFEDERQAARLEGKGAKVDYYGRWIPLDPNEEVGLWTDDYSPLIPILKGEWRFWSRSDE
jgi:hypothetical protein